MIKYRLKKISAVAMLLCFALLLPILSSCEEFFDDSDVSSDSEQKAEESICRHQYVSDCASVCLLCGETRQPLAEHNMKKTMPGKDSKVSDATCSSPARYADSVCSLCGAKSEKTYTSGPTLSHSYANALSEKCEVCGMERTICASDFAKIVGKNGTKGAITFVFDDTSSVVASWLKNNYPELPVGYAVVTKNFAEPVMTESEETYADGNGNTVHKTCYLKDEDGKYVYSTEGKEQTIAFWQDILKTTNSVLISHTHYHEYRGDSNEGGPTTYSYKLSTSPTPTVVNTFFPIDSVYADVALPKQILKDLFGEDQGDYFADAGVGVDRNKNEAYWDAIRELYLGSRSTAKTVLNANNYSENQYKTPGLMCVTATAAAAGKTLEETRADQLNTYLSYLDSSAKEGGWIGFCIHNISPDDNVGKYGHPTSEHMMRILANRAIELAESGEVFLGRYDEVAAYYAAAVSYELKSEIRSGALELSLDGDGDTALTVRLSLDEVGTAIELYRDSERMDAEIRNDGYEDYILFDMLPGSTVTVKLP